jgi:hypothetical protein
VRPLLHDVMTSLGAFPVSPGHAVGSEELEVLSVPSVRCLFLREREGGVSDGIEGHPVLQLRVEGFSDLRAA